MSTDQQQLRESKVQIVGYFAINALQTQQIKYQNHSLQIQQKIQAFIQQKHQQSNFVPLNVVVESNSIAIIDNQQRAWLITNRWKEPISLTDLLRLKIHKIALGYNQLVANTRQGSILLVWGNKKPIDEANLTKYPLRTFKNKVFQLFQAFTINQSSKADLFLFPNLKKIAESQALFSIKSSDPLIVSYPKLQKMSFSHKIIGLSVGKYHKLCWDIEGKLFSWGCKSLALGHEYLPQEFQISQPKPVHNLKAFVLKAYAGVNYSLAVTIQGKIFEWGIKKQYPKGEELVFDPRQIQTPKGQKMVDLKGKGEKYAALSMSGKLYVWGKNAKGSFSVQKDQEVQGQNGWSQPTHLKQVTDCIIDFSIEDSFLAVVTAPKQFTTVSDSQKWYWANVKMAITKKIRLRTPRLATQFCEDKQNDHSTNRASLSFRHCVDPIQIAFNKRQSKIKYIKEAQNSDKIIKFIMQQPRLNPQFSEIILDRGITYREAKKSEELNCTQLQRSNNQSLQKLFYECEKRKEYAEFLVKGVYALQAKNKAYKIKRNKEIKTRQSTQPKIEKSYSSRLQQALQRKEDINNQFFEKTISKLESESAECRMRKRFEAQQLKKKKKQIDLCASTIQKQLIKAFLIKLCVKPISEARDVKIDNFASHLKLQRLENNIRGLFVKNRIKFKMRKMFQNQIFRYSLMTVVFRNYVKRFRQRALKSKSSFIVQSIMKNVIKEKFKVGISTCTFNVRKLQRFREWASMVKAQRKKCLKQMWKVYTLSMMKINSDHQSSAIFYLPKNVDDLQFQSLYQEKVSANPLLKLSNFLEKYSIFRIKANYFQKLVTLFTFENKTSKESRESKLINTLSKTRRYRIKFHDADDTNDRLNLIQADILPYSIHYNLLIHPKNYDIMIPQIMKQHEKWVRQEKKVFDKHLELILHEHAISYTRQRRVYDYQLAKYIFKQYESLSERRWKYIIEYNQTKQTFEKGKKEKELRRLLGMIGALEKLQQDCLPEKYMILEEALRRSDSPPVPSSSIIFTMGDFKRHFKSYYEALFLKAKELRRTFF